MLIISRKKDQKIILADDIEITVLEVGRNRVRFGINAPKSIPIHTHLKTTPPVTAATTATKVAEAKNPEDVAVKNPTNPPASLPASAAVIKRR
jgi:carbon storage regulator